MSLATTAPAIILLVATVAASQPSQHSQPFSHSSRSATKPSFSRRILEPPDISGFKREGIVSKEIKPASTSSPAPGLVERFSKGRQKASQAFKRSTSVNKCVQLNYRAQNTTPVKRNSGTVIFFSSSSSSFLCSSISTSQGRSNGYKLSTSDK
ncbi:hypothetical protein E2C01_102828 [Portunus trituberculatus]|uniref:Secreted protein n=1 Tax=Portunus trituberculatus TaxID=210409 RepID=A0A5B7KNP3_PORTR|nr:hypothetical protein [Portunus trituberculatus]